MIMIRLDKPTNGNDEENGSGTGIRPGNPIFTLKGTG